MHGLIWYQRSNSKIIRSCIVIFALFVLFGLPIWTIFEFIKFYQTIQIKTVTEASRGNVFRYPNLTVCHSRYFDNQLLKGLLFTFQLNVLLQLTYYSQITGKIVLFLGMFNFKTWQSKKETIFSAFCSPFWEIRKLSFSNSSNIKSPWWKMLSFLCLYKIKTCQITVFKILYGEMKSKASFHHSRFVYYGEMKSKVSFHHSRLLHTAIWQVFFLPFAVNNRLL